MKRVKCALRNKPNSKTINVELKWNTELVKQDNQLGNSEHITMS